MGKRDRASRQDRKKACAFPIIIVRPWECPCYLISHAHALWGADINKSFFGNINHWNFSGFTINRITANAVINFPQKSHCPTLRAFNWATKLQQLPEWSTERGKKKREPHRGAPASLSIKSMIPVEGISKAISKASSRNETCSYLYSLTVFIKS